MRDFHLIAKYYDFTPDDLDAIGDTTEINLSDLTYEVSTNAKMEYEASKMKAYASGAVGTIEDELNQLEDSLDSEIRENLGSKTTEKAISRAMGNDPDIKRLRTELVLAKQFLLLSEACSSSITKKGFMLKEAVKLVLAEQNIGNDSISGSDREARTANQSRIKQKLDEERKRRRSEQSEREESQTVPVQEDLTIGTRRREDKPQQEEKVVNTRTRRSRAAHNL